jgi:hypothetical protein
LVIRHAKSGRQIAGHSNSCFGNKPDSINRDILGVVMPLSILVVPVALHLIAATGGGIPTLNVFPSCRTAAAAQIAPSGRMQTCLMSEQRAHDKLVKEWSDFSGTDRTTCVSSMINFKPTYTELITCLEIALEVRKSSANQLGYGPSRLSPLQICSLSSPPSKPPSFSMSYIHFRHSDRDRFDPAHRRRRPPSESCKGSGLTLRNIEM